MDVLWDVLAYKNVGIIIGSLEYFSAEKPIYPRGFQSANEICDQKPCVDIFFIHSKAKRVIFQGFIARTSKYHYQ